MAWQRVGSVGDLGEGEMMEVEIGDQSIAIYRLDDGFFATDNICTHAFAKLTEGVLDDGCVECPLHAGIFDVRSGEALDGPVEDDLKVFPTKVEGDDILIDA